MDRTDSIGDVHRFYQQMRDLLQEKNISVEKLPLSHLCFRVATMQEYEKKHTEFKQVSQAYSQHLFKDRPFSIFVLKNPLVFSNTHTLRLLELPSPKLDQPFSTGFEHIGFVVGDAFPQFKKQYENLLGASGDRITFANRKTAKFYKQSLWETVQQEGQLFHSL